MNLESQHVFEARTAIQTFIIEHSASNDNEILSWIEIHGGNFEQFYNTTSPEMRERFAQAVQEHDVNMQNELLHAFAEYEAKLSNESTTIH